MGGKHVSDGAPGKQDKVRRVGETVGPAAGTWFVMTHGRAVRCLSISEKVPSLPPDPDFSQMGLAVLSWCFSQV